MRRLLAAVSVVAALSACSAGRTLTPPDVPDVPDVPGLPAAGETYAGQTTLVGRVQDAGGPKGLVSVWDPTFGTDDPSHANAVRGTLRASGVPEESILFADGDGGPGEGCCGWVRRVWDSLHRDTLVVVVPTTWAYDRRGDATRISALDVLFVSAAGNTDGFGSRDLFTPDHPHWVQHSGEEHDAWQEMLDSLATGKALFATYVNVNRQTGNVTPHSGTVRCGEARDACYAVVYGGRSGSSHAAPVLGALVFYLSQLWERPVEVVAALNGCAVDIGEPGVDDEYGRGIPTADCGMVHDREVLVAAESAATSGRSPVTDAIAGFAGPSAFPQSAATQISNGRPEVLIGPGLRGVRGSFEARGMFVAAAAGIGIAPLGAHSRLVRSVPAPFGEIGVRRDVFRVRGTSFATAASYGRDGSGLGAAVLRVGLAVGRDGRFPLRLYAGWTRLSGEVGIPGGAAVGAGRIRFSEGAPEARFSWSLSF